MVQVKVNEGVLEGEEVQNDYGGKYYSFKGIPYAEPPIGDLRFKAPIKKAPWDGVRMAKQHGPKCFQAGFSKNTTTGSEDCLYLNVYTPEIKPNKLLPVMFWIHGGGFTIGSGDDDLHGPEFFVRKDVILVTINYRLGVFGFMCLGTADIPGNAGMKDQVAALRWVRDNIKSFGGDPENVTIFGESAGGMSVSFHLLSPMSKGLFKRAISQSGTSLCWVANYLEPVLRAKTLAKQLGCTSDDDKEIYEFFKNQPPKSLVDNSIPMTYAEETKEGPKYYFGFVEEKRFDGIEAFWFEDFHDVLKNGQFHEGVDIINGYTEDEGVLYFFNTDVDKILAQANTFPEFFVPNPLTMSLPISQQIEVGRRMRSFYLKDKDATRENIEGLIRYFNFNMFVITTILWQKLYAAQRKNKLYFYKFTCKSERNFLSYVYKTHKVLSRPTVAHGDDLPYMFPLKIFGQSVDMESNIFKMIEQITTAWTNFAKYGDPTPDNTLGVKWTPYTLEDQDYLDIGEELVPKTCPEKEDVEHWEDILREYYPKLVV